jgi:hypothetical protein
MFMFMLIPPLPAAIPPRKSQMASHRFARTIRLEKQRHPAGSLGEAGRRQQSVDEETSKKVAPPNGHLRKLHNSTKS